MGGSVTRLVLLRRKMGAPIFFCLALIAAVWLASASTGLSSSGSARVMIGGDESLDACGSLGEVDLPGGAQTSAAVREGPGPDYPVSAALADGALVWLCDERDEWHGVIFGEDASACGIATPMPSRGAYDGPCDSGWVHRSAIRLAAG